MKTKLNLYKILLIVTALTLLTVLGLACLPARASAYADEGSSYVPPTPSTEYIDSEEDFLLLQSARTEAKKYILTTDIYLDRYYAASDSTFKIATFEGELDGMGHAIVGLKLSSVATSVALFDTIAPGARVSNLNIIDASVSTGDAAFAAICAVKNFGVIDNVCVTGNVQGGRAAGIAVMNFGSISNSASMANISATIEIPASSEGEELTGVTAGAEIAVSSSSLFGAESNIPQKYIDSGYEPSYVISGCYARADKPCVADGSDSFTEYNSGSPFADGVRDYVGLLLYLDRFTNAPEDDKPIASQTGYINFYNSPLTERESKTLDYAIGHNMFDKGIFSGSLGGGAAHTEFAAAPELSGYLSKYTEITQSKAITPVNSDAVTYYPISSIGDLMKAETYDGAGVTFLLTADINLFVSSGKGAYPSYGAFFATLKGTIEGNGKIISGLAGALVDTIESSGVVRNLTVIGGSADGLIANTNMGKVEYVDAYGYGLMVAYNNGAISHCSVSASGVAYASSTGMASYTRNYLGAFYAIDSVDTGACSAEYCISYGGDFNTTALTKCVTIDNDSVIVSTDTNLSNLVTINDSDRITRAGELRPIYCTGWKFAARSDWAYIAGVVKDIPSLVFPSDRVEYKGLTKLKTTTSSVTRRIGNNSLSGTVSVQGALADDAAFLSKPLYREGNEAVRYDDGVFYFAQSAIGDLAMRSYFEYIVNSLINEDLLDLISGTENSEYSWYVVRDTGERALATADEVDSVSGTYRFYMIHRYLWVRATVSLTYHEDKNFSATLDYNVVQYGIHYLNAYGDLGMGSLTSSLAALGFERSTNVADPIAFEEVSVCRLLDGEEHLGTLLCDRGVYRFEVAISSTLTTTATVLYCEYIIEEGVINLDEYEVTYSGGGLTRETAPVYKGSSFSIPTGAFTLKDFRHYQVEYYYSILAYERYDRTIEDASVIEHAGIYTLELTIDVYGYASVTRQFEFYVERKPVAVTILLDQSEISFYDELPTVSYTSAEFGNGTAAVFPGLDYTSIYVKGSHALTNYSVSLKLSDATIAFDRDFIPTVGDSAIFYVKPAALDLAEVGFGDIDVVYDGEAHSTVVDTRAIKLRAGDTSAYRFTITYAYDGELSSEPFSFTAKGTYSALSASIMIDTDDYYSPVELSGRRVNIAPLGVTIEANDVTVAYGDDAVYGVVAYRSDGGTAFENFLNHLVRDTDYTVTSAYIKNSTKAGSIMDIELTLPKGSEIGNYTLTLSERTARLTVGKRTYSIALNSTDYVYSGAPVALDFNGVYRFDEGYPKYYFLSNAGSVEMDGVPVNATRYGTIYRAELRISESDEYYAYSGYVDFVINAAESVFSGLYLYKNNVIVGKLTNNLDYVYDGANYKIDIDRSQVNAHAAYAFRYRYRLYDDSGDAYYYDSEEPIIITHATRIKDVCVTLSSDGNFTSWDSAEHGINISSFSISPLEISIADALAPLEYKITAYTAAELTSIANAPTTNGVVGDDVVTFSVDLGAQTLRLPGDYIVTVGVDNHDYIFDSGRTRDLSVTIVAATVTIDLKDRIFVYRYGEVCRTNAHPNPRITERFAYTLAGLEKNTDITFIVGSTSAYPVPYEYAVTGALSLKEDGVETVVFSVTNGESALRILPKEISFSWDKITDREGENYGFTATYEYSGESLYMPVKFSEENVEGTLNDDPDLRIRYSEVMKHVGSYTMEAYVNATRTAPDGREVSCYAVSEALRAFSVTITPLTVGYSVAPKIIYTGEPFPTEFDITYDGGFLPPDGYSVTFGSVDYRDAVGVYSVAATAKVSDGGREYYDYILVKNSAEELRVINRRFGDFTVDGASAVYTGEPVALSVSGLSAEAAASVSYSALPVDCGSYRVTVTVSAAGYDDKIAEVDVVITPAEVVVSLEDNRRIRYSTDYLLSGGDIIATATFRGQPVDGEFRFTAKTPPQILVYGSKDYSIEFIPASANFRPAKNIAYRIEGYIEDDAPIFVTGVDNDRVDDVSGAEEDVLEVVSDKEYEIVAEIPEYLRGSALLYVNGSAVLGGKYVVKKSMDNILVEIRLGTEVILSKRLSVTVMNAIDVKPSEPEPSTPEPSTPSTETPSGNNGSGNVTASMSEDGKKTLIIIGATLGGAAVLGGGVAVAIVLIRKKRKRSE